jgi:FdhD protein
MNMAWLATMSAPTSLAIDIAQRAGMRLLSFCRQDGFVEYTANDPQRPESVQRGYCPTAGS